MCSAGRQKPTQPAAYAPRRQSLHAQFFGESLAPHEEYFCAVTSRARHAQRLAQSTPKHPFTFEDMMALKRVGAPVPSPDGKWVVFDCVDVDLEANTKISHLVDRAGQSAANAAAIESNAESRGAAALFAGRQTADLDVESDRSDANLDVRFRSRKRGARWQAASGDDDLDRRGWRIWSPDGKNIVFVSGGLSGLQRRCMQQATR